LLLQIRKVAKSRKIRHPMRPRKSSILSNMGSQGLNTIMIKPPIAIKIKAKKLRSIKSLLVKVFVSTEIILLILNPFLL
jgi:hypothetical protein